MSGFNGSGTYVISGTGLPYVTGTTISSTVANQLNADLATGLSNVICKDGQSTPTNNIPMGAFKLTGLGVATATGDALSYGNIGTMSALTVTNIVTGAAFTTVAGNFSLPQLTATTFTALASSGTGTYLVSCQLQISDPTSFGQLAVVIQDNGVLAITNLMSGSNMVVSASGLNLKATNNFAGGTNQAFWSITRLR